MEQSIEAILTGNSSNILQLQVVKIYSPSVKDNQSFYKMTLSDGKYTVLAVLHHSLSSLVKNSVIKEGSIVRVADWAIVRVESSNKRVLRINAKVTATGHERIKNYKDLVECPAVTIVREPLMVSEEDEGDIGPVYTGAETIPRPEVTAEEHWEPFTSNHLRFVTSVGKNYMYIEDSAPLKNVHANSPPRKCDVYAAAVIKTTQTNDYCRGYTLSFDDKEAVIVAVVILTTGSAIKLAVLDITSGQISFRAPVPGEVVRKEYRFSSSMASAWQQHMNSASAKLAAAKEKRASRTQTNNKALPRRSAPQHETKSSESSESSDSEVELITNSKRKASATAEPPAKRQKVDKHKYQLSDHLIPDEENQSNGAMNALADEVRSLKQLLDAVNRQIAVQRQQLQDFKDEVECKQDLNKKLCSQVASMTEELSSMKAEVAKLTSKVTVSNQSEKIVYVPAPRPVETRYIQVPEYYQPEPSIIRTPTRYSPYSPYH